MPYLSWKKTAFIFFGGIGLMISTQTFSGTGRGDFHTLYNGQSVDDLIIQYMEENNIPGLTLAIVQAPYITRVVGYGLADTNTKRLASTNTVFNVGQMTNAFTAIAIMQLKEEGKLKLEDSLAIYLTDVPKAWQAITLNDLMIHSSGLSSYTEAAGFDYSKDYTPTQIIALVKDKPLLFEPGTKVNNSATDSYLLGLVIEKASGVSYQEYVTKNQIERAGLKHTFFIANQDTIHNEVKNGTQPFKHSQFLQDASFINPTELATGYTETNGALMPSQKVTWSATYAASGIIASAQDISQWDISLAGDILVKDPKDREFLYNSVKLKNGQMIPGNVGWLFPGHKGLMEIKGNIPGYSAFLSRFTAPTELLCVTLLANKGDLPDLDVLGRHIAASFDINLGTPQGVTWSQTMQSPYSVEETIDRANTLVKSLGGTVFAHINHSGEASKVGLNLPATQVLVIGNPAKGTALMQANSAMALDLPLRIMATTDNTGQVWLSYTDPVALAKEYHFDAKQMQVAKQISLALRRLCQKVVSPNSVNKS